jgi:hypothetical protein
MAINPTLASELSKEAERIEEDAQISGKSHYNAVEPWRTGHRLLGITSALGSALAGVAVLKEWAPAIALAAAAASTVAAVVLTTLKPSEEADRHQRSGDSYLRIRNRARIFRSIEMIASTATEEELVRSIRELSSILDEARSAAPGIPRRAYEKALQDIEEGRAKYQADTRPGR